MNRESNSSAQAPPLAFEPTADPLAFRVHVPKDLVFFQGHFKQLPVLPAVVQLSAIAVPLARRVWPDLGRLVALRRVRWRRPIGPGTTLLVTVGREGERVNFEVLMESTTAAKGTLEFAPSDGA